MTKEEFISTFSDSSKISAMDSILSDIFDEIEKNVDSPVRIISSHIKSVIKEASNDSRLVDIFIEDRLHNLKRNLENIKINQQIQEMTERIMNNTKPKI